MLQSASSPEVGELSELGVKVSCSMESWLFDGILKLSTLAFSTLEAGDFSRLKAEDVMAFGLGPRSAGDRRWRNRVSDNDTLTATINGKVLQLYATERRQ